MSKEEGSLKIKDISRDLSSLKMYLLCSLMSKPLADMLHQKQQSKEDKKKGWGVDPGNGNSTGHRWERNPCTKPVLEQAVEQEKQNRRGTWSVTFGQEQN